MKEIDFTMGKYTIAVKNADYAQRAVERMQDLTWLDSNSPGVSVKFIEASAKDRPRLTMLIRFAPGSRYDLGQYHGGEEFLVLEGSLSDSLGLYRPGFYVRNPTETAHQLYSKDGCLLFLKLGEFGETDHAQRIINTNEEEDWLPGPVAGTRVLPLHMHDTRSVLMIRWDCSAQFKPGLDPQGEEIFVVRGALEDKQGYYPQGCWIRNPIPSWQSWTGTADTLAYYKNGHFPD